MKTHYWLPFALLVFIKYATTTSLANQINLQRVANSNLRPTITEQPTPPFQVHMYRENVENDEEDMVEDAELSPSEVIETFALPETPDSGDPAAAVGSDVGVQRVRRRRRRRRRKRPKPTAGVAPVADTSAATVAPVKSPNRFDAYYTLPEDEIRRKPFKYHRGVGGGATDDNAELTASQMPPVDGYTRRRPTKRRRRPLKKPVDDYSPPSFDEDDDNDGTNNNNNGEESWTNSENHASTFSHHYQSENATSAVPTTTTPVPSTSSSSSSTRKPDLSKLTTSAIRNKPSPPPFKEDASQSVKPTATAVDLAGLQDTENSLKKRKRPLAHNNHDENDENGTPRASVEQNIVVKVGRDENSKSIDNRKELFKLRRLPPTWAILGHAKLGQSASQTTKNESSVDKNSNRNNAPKQTVVDQAEAVAVPKNNLVRESEQRPATASSKTLTTTTVRPPPPSPPVQNNRNEATGGQKSNDTGTADSFPFPIITTYNGQKQPMSKTDVDVDIVNSNASVFSSANDQRLTIIYVPCNQTMTSSSSSSAAVAVAADKLFKTGGGAFFHHSTTENSILSDDVSAAESSTVENTSPETRKISTTRLPSSEHHAQLDESASEPRLEDATKLSSTARHTTSTPPVSSSTANAGREPKHYHDDTVSNSKSNAKSESAKENQTPTWQIRKPYPSPVLNAPSSKPFVGSSKEIIISYTSTTNSPPSLFSYHNIDSADEQISLQLRNNYNNNNNSIRINNSDGGNNDALLHRKTSSENTLVNRIKYQQHHQQQQNHHYVERKKLPLAVKSAIIISGAVLALAVLGFFALLLSCKIRQAKSRMKCHRQLYRDQFQSNEFRQSSRSTSPVMSKSNYNTRNFTNNMQPVNVAAAAASNRNYYLWQTLRKTFQYD